MITIRAPQRRVVVRWPFRALAALILVTMVATGGAVVWSWHGEHSFGRHEQMLVHLPGYLWFGRLLFFSVVRSSLPPSGNAWPFASDRLLGAYLLGVMLFDYVL